MSEPLRPIHYTDMKPEPIEVIDSWKLGFNLGNVIKYIGRADSRGDRLNDLRKAATYLAFEIEKEEKERPF